MVTIFIFDGVTLQTSHIRTITVKDYFRYNLVKRFVIGKQLIKLQPANRVKKAEYVYFYYLFYFCTNLPGIAEKRLAYK